jgi:hypothetical protein
MPAGREHGCRPRGRIIGFAVVADIDRAVAAKVFAGGRHELRLLARVALLALDARRAAEDVDGRAAETDDAKVDADLRADEMKLGGADDEPADRPCHDMRSCRTPR